MEEFKGTPGPWEANHNGHYLDIRPAGSCQILATTQVNSYLDIDDDVEVKNANLIAAAPEMLEACLRIQAQFRQAGIVSVAGSLNPIEDSAAQIDAVILKALGQ